MSKTVGVGEKKRIRKPHRGSCLRFGQSPHRRADCLLHSFALQQFGEPKSEEDSGVAVEIWFQKGNKKLVGFGHEPNDISLDGVKRALAKAKRDAVEDQDFNGFLKPDKNVSKIKKLLTVTS